MARVDDDRMDPGGIDLVRPRHRRERACRRRGSLVQVENDAERIVEPIGIGDDVRRGEVDPHVGAVE